MSNKLPGTPIKITALDGKGEAEMATDSGAIYSTSNAAYTWKAAVQETVDATLNRTVSSGISGASYYEGSFANIVRNTAGDYLGVSARGNFYMTWSPGDENWTPYNRPANRRIQNLGWTNDDKIWVSSRGGDLMVNSNSGITGEGFQTMKIGSRGFGILDFGCALARVVIMLICQTLLPHTGWVSLLGGHAAYYIFTSNIGRNNAF